MITRTPCIMSPIIVNPFDLPGDSMNGDGNQLVAQTDGTVVLFDNS